MKSSKGREENLIPRTNTYGIRAIARLLAPIALTAVGIVLLAHADPNARLYFASFGAGLLLTILGIGLGTVRISRLWNEQRRDNTDGSTTLHWQDIVLLMIALIALVFVL